MEFRKLFEKKKRMRYFLRESLDGTAEPRTTAQPQLWSRH